MDYSPLLLALLMMVPLGAAVYLSWQRQNQARSSWWKAGRALGLRSRGGFGNWTFHGDLDGFAVSAFQHVASALPHAAVARARPSRATEQEGLPSADK